MAGPFAFAGLSQRCVICELPFLSLICSLLSSFILTVFGFDLLPCVHQVRPTSVGSVDPRRDLSISQACTGASRSCLIARKDCFDACIEHRSLKVCNYAKHDT